MQTLKDSGDSGIGLVREMAQCGKVLVTKPDSPSSSSRTSVVKGLIPTINNFILKLNKISMVMACLLASMCV